MRTLVTTVLILLLPIAGEASASESENLELLKDEETLCGGVEPLDTTPDRPLKFGYETNLLLLLTKPYIARQDGILSKWQFINSNKTLVAEMNPNAVWSNGQRVTAQEAVLGIIAGLKHRTIAASIRLKSEKELPNAATLLKKNLESVRIWGTDRFEIDFEGSVKDISGIIIEALNENSRINRVWPIRIENGKRINDIVGKSKTIVTSKNIVINPFKNTPVKIVYGNEDCSTAQYYLSSSLLTDQESNFEFSFSSDEQALLAIINPNHKETSSQQSRIYIADLARKRLQTTKSDLFRSTSKLIQPNEPGYQTEGLNSITDDNKTRKLESKIIKVRPWTKIPDNWNFKIALETQKTGEPSFKFDRDNPKSHIFLTVAPVKKGRLNSLENGTTFNEISKNKVIFPETFAALENMRRKSNSSVPKDPNLFIELERAIKREASIAPLGRFKISLLSRKTSKLKLSWQANGEIEFLNRRTK